MTKKSKIESNGEDAEVIALDSTTNDDSTCTDGFLIDMDGDDVVCEAAEVVNSYGSVPKYDTGYSGILTTKEFSMETGVEVKNDARPKKTCFNCLGDHSIADCTKERDFKQININKKKILGNRSATRSSNRYHEDFENCCGDIRPGQISQDLRNALGIYDNEMPLFYYRMRYLGYPPGWLKHAEVHRTSVCLFDGDGVELAHPEAEEGEDESSFTKYEPEKLIEYPGFNVKLPDSFRDQTREHNMPRMSRHQSKEHFKEYMVLNKATKYKKKKLKTSDTPISTDQLDGQGNSSDSLDKTKALDDSVVEVDGKGNPISLNEGGDGRLSHDDSSINDTSQNSTINLDTTQESETADSISLSSEQEPRQFQSKGFDLGIHIPPSITNHTVLPTFDKWNVDISDHIDFENLPDALGMWSKMKGVVSNVKKLMDKIQKDHDKDSESD